MGENNSIQDIFDKLKSSKKVLMSLHRGPDGDSLASACAMKYLLERDFNSDVTVISPDELPEELNLFEFSKEVSFGKEIDDFNIKEFDLIIFVDHGSLENYLRGKEIEFPKGNLMDIDHHYTNSHFGDLNYVDDSKPSACSVLLDLFKKWGVVFDEELSTRLLLGIYTDSGWLAFDDGNSLREAAFLVDNKARYRAVVEKIRFNVPLKIKKYFSKLVDRFRVEKFGDYSVGVSTLVLDEIKYLGLSPSEIRYGSNYLQEIGGLDFLFTLIDNGKNIKGSFRSRKNVNVAKFAEALGGGGHRFAAAFIIENLSLEEVEKRVFEVIKEVGIHIEK